MKIPSENDADKQAEIREANARAIRAQDDALMLRNKLEQMEALLTQTRTKLADANQQLEAKDQRLRNVQTETKALAQSVSFLEERFGNLRKLQTELSEKREDMIATLTGLSEHSTSEVTTTSSTEVSTESATPTQSDSK